MILGEARQTQLVTTFGVGSMYPSQDQSLMVCGLDEWPVEYGTPVAEPRLARSLGVHELRTPSAGRRQAGDVPVTRFPTYYFCPECRRLDRIWNFDASTSSPRCQECGRKIVPSRFVMCCAKGHIDDFPYQRWVHAGRMPAETHRLELRTRGETSSLADIEVRCRTCGQHRSLDGAFSPMALRSITHCTGRRPWLSNTDQEPCTEPPRILQRGSSSVWFGNLRSAISIPPWSQAQAKLTAAWGALKSAKDDALRLLFDNPEWISPDSGLTIDRLISMVKELRGESVVTNSALTDEAIRAEEYKALLDGQPELSPSDQFVCTAVPTESSRLQGIIKAVRNVSRLREVTALVSFSRVAPAGADSPNASPLALRSPTWLPATEIFGEGIFIQLDERRLAGWAKSTFARTRVGMIEHASQAMAHPMSVSARHLLVHSFSHAFMNELSLDAGYPVASLRERIYAAPGQAGVLIYTATADSAGSLGGLSAQSSIDRLTSVIQGAAARAQWCSSDPICIESMGSGINNLNLAACHACLLVPETSCEHRNTLLDRGLLAGTPGSESEGFFSELL